MRPLRLIRSVANLSLLLNGNLISWLKAMYSLSTLEILFLVKPSLIEHKELVFNREFEHFVICPWNRLKSFVGVSNKLSFLLSLYVILNIGIVINLHITLMTFTTFMNTLYMPLFITRGFSLLIALQWLSSWVLSS